MTRDGGETWDNVTERLRGLPPRGTVSNVEPSRHGAATAYLAVDRHQLGDTDPYIYKTSDYGKTWKRIDAGIERSVFSYTHCVREDPVRPGLLYVGTENGVLVSFDDGAAWHSLQTNLPHVPVHWLEVQDHFNDLVLATYGRGFWILDDVTPLQQLDEAALDAEALSEGLEKPVLLAPRDAYRFRLREPPMSQPEDPAAGRNPQYGASLHYLLTAEPEGEVEVAILDSAGEIVRVLEDVPAESGLHRVYWDLRYERTREVKLRTRPEENPHVPTPDQGWRELSDGGRIAVLAPPGTYTVRLKVGDEELTRELEVVKDPNSAGSHEEIAEQMEVLFALRDMLNKAADMINEVEWLRKSIYDLDERLADTDDPDAEEIAEAARELDGGLKELESHFFDLRLTGARQDTLRWRRLLYARIGYLARLVGKSDFAPNRQHREVFEVLKQELEGHERRFGELLGEVAAFNEMLSRKGVPSLVIGLKASNDGK